MSIEEAFKDVLLNCHTAVISLEFGYCPYDSVGGTCDNMLTRLHLVEGKGLKKFILH